MATNPTVFEQAILRVLTDVPQRTQEIAAQTGMSSRSVATKLCWMRGAGLVKGSALKGWWR